MIMKIKHYPKISVIIPCYNHGEYIESCLESIRKAYVGKLEVIICDDCSSDNTVIKIKNFLANNIDGEIEYKLIINSKNKGVSRTLNDSIKLATADYIYIIASDDCLLNNGLTRAMHFMLGLNCDAIISDCIVIDDKDKMISESAFFEYRKASLNKLIKDISNELIFNWVVPGPSLLQKRSAFEIVGGYNETLMAEDRDYYLRLLSVSEIYFNPDKIACYRIHGNNVSRSVEYIKKSKNEFARVNYKASENFRGLAGLYLRTYWLDLNGIPSIVTSLFRKTLKAVYRMGG